jgi:predicted metal-binding membrane protein
VGGVSTVTARFGASHRSELAEAFAAVRARLALVALLLALAALAWSWTVRQMSGMDAGPGGDLGGLGWFVGVWVVMMAAMMFPSLAPTVALYARMTKRRGIARPVVFTASYLLVWGVAGFGAYALFRVGRTAFGSGLAWDDAGRWFVCGVLAVAAVYEVSPVKDVCLTKCRSPLGFLIGSWREGWRGAVAMGSKHGVWCLGCCWALMAGLFALGVMNLAWMAFVAALIALEKTLPWHRVAVWGTAGLLLLLAAGVAVAPHDVPWLVVPGSAHGGMHGMQAMH